MKRKGTRYTPVFRRRMVVLVRSGRTAESLGREFGPSAESIRKWVAQVNREERRELDLLRRESRRLRQECEILEKANAWFARKTDPVPPKSSGS